jgi:hypothetical protein
MNTTQRLPPQLEEAVQAGTEAHGFDGTVKRWLAFLLKDDPTLPAPTAGAMVARVCELPIGGDLVTLDATLQLLETRKPSVLTTSERRVTAMLLKALVSQAHTLLTAIT